MAYLNNTIKLFYKRQFHHFYESRNTTNILAISRRFPLIFWSNIVIIVFSFYFKKTNQKLHSKIIERKYVRKNKKPLQIIDLQGFIKTVVGAAGFEPAAPCSQSKKELFFTIYIKLYLFHKPLIIS